MEQSTGFRPVIYGLEPGDKIEYIKTYRRGKKSKQIKHVCTVVGETLGLITLQAEHYKITVDKRDIGKDVQLYRLGDEGMNNEPKITKEELLDECRELGTDKEARYKIAEKYGLKASTLEVYIHQWKIKDLLKADQAPVTTKPAEQKEEVPDQIDKVNEKAADKFATEPEPKPNLDLLRTRYIGVTGEVYDYEISQGNIKITDADGISKLFTIGAFDGLIRELQAAKEAHQRLF